MDTDVSHAVEDRLDRLEHRLDVLEGTAPPETVAEDVIFDTEVDSEE